MLISSCLYLILLCSFTGFIGIFAFSVVLVVVSEECPDPPPVHRNCLPCRTQSHDHRSPICATPATGDAHRSTQVRSHTAPHTSTHCRMHPHTHVSRYTSAVCCKLQHLSVAMAREAREEPPRTPAAPPASNLLSTDACCTHTETGDLHP